MKWQPSLAAFLIGLAGLASASVAHASTTAVYNPATGLVTVQGIAVSQTLTITNVPIGLLTLPTGNPLFGTVSLTMQCAASTVSIKVGDAILGELPSTWSYFTGSYLVEGTATTGTVSETPYSQAAYPGSPSATTDTGFAATFGEATADFPASQYPSGADLQTTVEYAVPGSPSPVGVVLKGVLVARAAYNCSGTPVVTIGTLSTQPALSFPSIISAADPENVTTVTLIPAAPALPAWGPWLLATLLAGVALVSRRAASAT